MNQMFVPKRKLPPVIVISLVDSDVRRARISTQLAEAGVPFRFFDAERIEAYPPEYDGSISLRMYANHLTFGGGGYYDSHYRIWQDLARSDDDIWCVLEDDIELTPDFARRLTEVLDVPLPWGACD